MSYLSNQFYKPRTKKEIIEFLKQHGRTIGKLRSAPFKQLFAIYCGYFKS